MLGLEEPWIKRDPPKKQTPLRNLSRNPEHPNPAPKAPDLEPRPGTPKICKPYAWNTMTAQKGDEF